MHRVSILTVVRHCSMLDMAELQIAESSFVSPRVAVV